MLWYHRCVVEEMFNRTVFSENCVTRVALFSFHPTTIKQGDEIVNEVYVSGKIVKMQRRPVAPEDDRFYFLLQVAHRAPLSPIVVENFVVYTWRQTAKWAIQHLSIGDEVLVKGALTHICSDMRRTVISAARVIITRHSTPPGSQQD